MTLVTGRAETENIMEQNAKSQEPMPKPAANEHVEQLNKARHRLVEIRRAFAKQLAGPFERGKTDDARKNHKNTDYNRGCRPRDRGRGKKLIFSGANKKMPSGQPGQKTLSATMMTDAVAKLIERRQSGDGLTVLEIITAERILTW